LQPGIVGSLQFGGFGGEPGAGIQLAIAYCTPRPIIIAPAPIPIDEMILLMFMVIMLFINF
jgi:hypothetical protein